MGGIQSFQVGNLTSGIIPGETSALDLSNGLQPYNGQ